MIEGDTVSTYRLSWEIAEAWAAAEDLHRCVGFGGLFVSSAKDGVIVGADIIELLDPFVHAKDEIVTHIVSENAVFRISGRRRSSRVCRRRENSSRSSYAQARGIRNYRPTYVGPAGEIDVEH